MIIVGCLIFMIMKVTKLFKKVTSWFLLGQKNCSLTFIHNGQTNWILEIDFFINHWNQILIFNVQKSHPTNPLHDWWANAPPHTSYLLRAPRTMSVEYFCVMWRKFRWEDILDVEKFHMWRNFGCEENLRYAVAWMVFVLFYRKIWSVGIYAILSRHLFCRDLRAFNVETN